MFMLIFFLPAAVVWCLLAGEGIKRGRHGEVVIFRGWVDFALTVALVVPMLTLMVALPWLWMTARANRRHRDLWVVVPAKISLAVFAVACSVIAISSAITALSPKAEARRRMANAAVALGVVAIALGVFRPAKNSLTVRLPVNRASSQN